MEKNEQRKRYAGQTTMTTKQNPAQTHMERKTNTLPEKEDVKRKRKTITFVGDTYDYIGD